MRGDVTSSTGHHRANTGSWAAVVLIILGFTVGVFALVLHSIPLWIITGVALVLGGIVAVASKIMEQAY
jgi:xanthine/uracil permease